MRMLSVLLALSLGPSLARGQADTVQGYVPSAGFVPDSATAVRIAVAVWIPIYGERHIMSERPFVAILSKGVWTVSGSLPKPLPGYVTIGGTAVAKIAQRDGRILFVTHYQ